MNVLLIQMLLYIHTTCFLSFSNSIECRNAVPRQCRSILVQNGKPWSISAILVQCWSDTGPIAWGLQSRPRLSSKIQDENETQVRLVSSRCNDPAPSGKSLHCPFCLANAFRLNYYSRRERETKTVLKNSRRERDIFRECRDETETNVSMGKYWCVSQNISAIMHFQLLPHN